MEPMINNTSNNPGKLIRYDMTEQFGMMPSTIEHSNGDRHKTHSREIVWSLYRNNTGKIPINVQREYDILLDDHNKKKKVEETFFQHKVADYTAYFNDQIVPMNHKQVMYFSEIKGINSLFVKNLERLNFNTLTAIQQTTIPIGIEGKDIIGCSDTGSGKTLAFLIPIINRMINRETNIENPDKFPPFVTCPYILIMAPTRELAEQINAEARKLINNTGIHSVAIYGGVKIYEQQRKLTYGCEILVSTPGRLIDMLKQQKISLKYVKFLVLDEADEMLNMGFLPQIKEVCTCFDLCPRSERQNLMFSATFEEEIKALARNMMNEFFFVSNGNGAGNKDSFNFHENSSNKKWKVKENVIQIVVPAQDQAHKIRYICDMMHRNPNSGAIVFVDKKQKVDEIKAQFNFNRLPATSIHGDKPQQIRQNAVDEFKRGKFKVIVATNILARGLDFVDVDYVFNFDLPMNIEDYIHRIGRTGRLGTEGYAITFIEREDKFKKVIKELICYIRKCGKEVPEWLASLFPELKRYNNNVGSSTNYVCDDSILKNKINMQKYPNSNSNSNINDLKLNEEYDHKNEESRDKERSYHSSKYKDDIRDRDRDRRRSDSRQRERDYDRNRYDKQRESERPRDDKDKYREDRDRTRDDRDKQREDRDRPREDRDRPRDDRDRQREDRDKIRDDRDKIIDYKDRSSNYNNSHSSNGHYSNNSYSSRNETSRNIYQSIPVNDSRYNNYNGNHSNGYKTNDIPNEIINLSSTNSINQMNKYPIPNSYNSNSNFNRQPYPSDPNYHQPNQKELIMSNNHNSSFSSNGNRYPSYPNSNQHIPINVSTNWNEIKETISSTVSSNTNFNSNGNQNDFLNKKREKSPPKNELDW